MNSHESLPRVPRSDSAKVRKGGRIPWHLWPSLVRTWRLRWTYEHEGQKKAINGILRVGREVQTWLHNTAGLVKSTMRIWLKYTTILLPINSPGAPRMTFWVRLIGSNPWRLSDPRSSRPWDNFQPLPINQIITFQQTYCEGSKALTQHGSRSLCKDAIKLLPVNTMSRHHVP